MKPTPASLDRNASRFVWPTLLAIALIVAVLAAFYTRAQIADTFARQRAIQQTQLRLEELLRLEISEQNFIRAYAITKDTFYRQQYDASVTQFDAGEASIRRELESEGLQSTIGSMVEYSSAQNDWRREVAQPMLARPDAKPSDIDKRNKMYSDYEEQVANAIRADLAGRSRQLARDAVLQLNRTLWVSALVFLVFGVLAITFNTLGARLGRKLERERMTTDILQRAFRSEHIELPNCSVGSAYAAARSNLAVGGDVFDMYRLSDALALILIADVSGKGVDAAVLTAFIKFTIRGIALRRRDPGAILAEFNTAFSHTVDNPYLFVSMFVGVLDIGAGTLRYASAGHDSAFVRRATGVQQLAVTGPVLGVMEEPFGTQVVHLADGDTLVLATDGLTEARSRRGEMLGESGAMQLIEGGSEDPQRLADGLVAKVRALEGNQLRDDLAILAIRLHAEAADA